MLYFSQPRLLSSKAPLKSANFQLYGRFRVYGSGFRGLEYPPKGVKCTRSATKQPAWHEKMSSSLQQPSFGRVKPVSKQGHTFFSLGRPSNHIQQGYPFWSLVSFTNEPINQKGQKGTPQLPSFLKPLHWTAVVQMGKGMWNPPSWWPLSTGIPKATTSSPDICPIGEPPSRIIPIFLAC